MKLALSGVWNTWKSSIINWVRKDNNLVSKWLKHLQLHNVLFFWETARKYMDDLPDFTLFQNHINRDELHRLLILDNIKENAVIDRTFYDNVLYANKNGVDVQDTSIDSDIYDKVILLTDPIKQTFTKDFDHYNDDEFIDTFNNWIRERYWDKVVEYTNWFEQWDKIIYDLYNLLK